MIKIVVVLDGTVQWYKKNINLIKIRLVITLLYGIVEGGIASLILIRLIKISMSIIFHCFKIKIIIIINIIFSFFTNIYIPIFGFYFNIKLVYDWQQKLKAVWLVLQFMRLIYHKNIIPFISDNCLFKVYKIVLNSW